MVPFRSTPALLSSLAIVLLAPAADAHLLLAVDTDGDGLCDQGLDLEAPPEARAIHVHECRRLPDALGATLP